MRKTVGAANHKKYREARVKSHMPAVVITNDRVPVVTKKARPVVW